MSIITSAHNEKIKEIKRLQKGGRFYWWEGLKFFEEITKENITPELLIVSEGALTQHYQNTIEHPALKTGTNAILTVSDAVFKGLSFTESPQGIGGLIKVPQNGIDALKAGQTPVFYLAGVQDPGNVGGIVRTADAFGFSGIVYEKRGASPYSEKAVRASAGSILRVTCVKAGSEVLKTLMNHGYRIFILTPRSEDGLNIMDPVVTASGKSVFVLGQEGSGVDFDVEGAEKVYIPMSEQIDSLNVAVTAGVVGFMVYGGERKRC